MMKSFSAATAALVAMVALAGGAEAQTKTKLYIGSLNCNVSGGAGLLFGSTKELTCVFVTTDGKAENYKGSINKFGIDIGFTKAAHTLWHVYSLGTDRGPGALNGQFAGGQESLAVGVSAGTNALFGGRNNEIVMETVAISDKKSGLNFADGVAEMTLRPAP